MHKIVTDKDGKMSTTDGPVEGEAQRSLERTRKELKDMIAGNTQFHTDTIGKDKPKEPSKAVVEEQEEFSYGVWGMFP